MDTDAYILLITHQFNSNLSFRTVSDAVRRRKLRQSWRQSPQSRVISFCFWL